MTDTARRIAVEQTLQAMFLGTVSVAVEAITPGADADLWPEELQAVAGAVPARTAEFAAGRTAARRALLALGVGPFALPMGSDRAPIWPAGIFGSISHAVGLAVVVCSQDGPLGVDLEEDAPIEAALWSTICSETELSRLPIAGRDRHVRKVFAAKEAIFKAQHPGKRAMFGFDVVDVTLAETTFYAHFLSDAGQFRAGQHLTGRLMHAPGVVLAGVVG